MAPPARTIREGTLSTTALPGLVYSILSQKETGVLTLTGETAVKAVYIQSGRPVFASSNDRDDRKSWERIWEAVGGLRARYRSTGRASPLRDFEICRLLWAFLTLDPVQRQAGG